MVVWATAPRRRRRSVEAVFVFRGRGAEPSWGVGGAKPLMLPRDQRGSLFLCFRVLVLGAVEQKTGLTPVVLSPFKIV